MYESNNKKHQKKLAETIGKYRAVNKFDYLYKASDELNEHFKEDLKMEGWRSRYRRLEEEYLNNNKKIAHKYNHNDELEDRLVAYLNQERTLDFLIEKLDMSEMELKGYILDLQIHGREISIAGDKVKLAKSPIRKELVHKVDYSKTNLIELGIVADTHIGSKWQQETYLKEAYDEFERRGITTVLHLGDISEGQSNRPEHRYEVFAHGADAQAEYIINNYPKKNSITTYFLTGNHDGWFMKSGGISIGKLIANERPDMVWIGDSKARIEIQNVKIDMIHPGDGSNRTVSLALQTAASVINKDDMPDILVSGHHHRYAHFVERGMHCFEIPALLGKTPFIAGKHLVNTIGYCFWTLRTDKQGNLVSITDETVIKDKEIENDYKIQEPTLKQKSFKI